MRIQQFKPIIIICLILLGILVYRSYDSKSVLNKENATIVLGEDGFSPDKVNIQVGQEVKFITTRNDSFWPASNPHPTHEIYPEFDSKKPIAPQGSWSFIFKKSGRWTYHNHLNPFYRGVINVEDLQGNVAENNCGKLDSSEKGGDRSLQFRCWEKLITKTIQEKGTDSALKLISELYKNEPNFGVSCHDLMHRVGEQSYKTFLNYKKVNLSYENSYCGYGFYHGFVDALIVNGGGAKQAREFCNYAKEQISKIIKANLDPSCFHGLGHGVAERDEINVNRENEQKIIDQYIPFCVKVADNDERLSSCVDGIIDSVVIALINGNNKKPGEILNVISICNNQKEIYKEACYKAAGSLQLTASRYDFDKAARLVATIPEKKYAIEYIRQISLSLSRAEITRSDNTKNIEKCHKLSGDYQINCIEAFVIGIMQVGRPSEEYIKAANFCVNGKLSETEKNSCFSVMIGMVRANYSKDKVQTVCEWLQEKYNRKCYLVGYIGK